MRQGTFPRFWIDRFVRAGIREDLGFIGNCEKFRKRISEGNGGDLFGRRQTRTDRPNPRAKRAPNQPRDRGRQYLKQSLRDESELNVAVISRHFPSYGITVGFGFSVEMLVAAFARQRRHGRHPEVIGIHPDDAERLFEGHFDFEPQSIDSDDLQGR